MKAKIWKWTKRVVSLLWALSIVVLFIQNMMHAMEQKTLNDAALNIMLAMVMVFIFIDDGIPTLIRNWR